MKEVCSTEKGLHPKWLATLYMTSLYFACLASLDEFEQSQAALRNGSSWQDEANGKNTTVIGREEETEFILKDENSEWSQS